MGRKRRGTRKNNVVLREKTLANGNISLYLDIYRSGKRSYEFLKLYIIDKPQTPFDREENNKNYQLAENVRTKREEELNHEEFEFIAPHLKKTNFLAFFQDFLDNYNKKDDRMVKGSYEHFKSFLKEENISLSSPLYPKDITPFLIQKYADYLQSKLQGETPASYFKRFKKVLTYAVSKNLFHKNPAAGISITINEGLKKDILTFKEIQALADADCPNSEVKRAFLFSLNTGLRWVDVNELKYRNVDYSNRKLTVNQAKTKHNSTNSLVTIDLNATAMRLIGEQKLPDNKIFNLPSHTGCLKNLKTWVGNAKINKHITWHCARHSFAVNLLGEVKTDIKTVASLLGHSGLKHTEKYTRAVDELKNKAVNAIPEIEIDNITF
jgi:integrase